MKILLVATITAITGIGPVSGQRVRGRDTPSAVAREAFAAWDREDFATLATLIDSVALDEFKERHLDMVTSPDREPTLSQLQQRFPPCVAAYFDSTMGSRSGRRKQRPSALSLLGVRDSAELAGLSAAKFFVRWLQADARMAHLEDSLFWSGQRADPDNPHAPFLRTKENVLGEVMVGDTLAYVVYEGVVIPPQVDTSALKVVQQRDTANAGVDTTLVFTSGEDAGVRVAHLRRQGRGRWVLTLDNLPFDRAFRVLEGL